MTWFGLAIVLVVVFVAWAVEFPRPPARQPASLAIAGPFAFLVKAPAFL